MKTQKMKLKMTNANYTHECGNIHSYT